MVLFVIWWLVACSLAFAVGLWLILSVFFGGLVVAPGWCYWCLWLLLVGFGFVMLLLTGWVGFGWCTHFGVVLCWFSVCYLRLVNSVGICILSWFDLVLCALCVLFGLLLQVCCDCDGFDLLVALCGGCGCVFSVGVLVGVLFEFGCVGWV